MATGGIQEAITIELIIRDTDDASSNQSFIVTRTLTVLDAKVTCTKAVAGGTIQVGKWTGVFNIITDVMVCDSLNVITRAGVVRPDDSTFFPGEALAAQANVANDTSGVICIDCLSPLAGLQTLALLP